VRFRFLEQAAVRHLEVGEASRALALTRQGVTLALEAGKVHMAGLFRAAERLALLRVRAAEAEAAASPPQRRFQRVERRAADLETQEFAHFSRLGQPVLLAAHPGRPLWGRDLDLAAMARRCSGRRLRLQRYDPSSGDWAAMRPHGEATLHGLMRRWEAGDRDAVVFDQSLAAACPRLREAWRWPRCVGASDLAGRAPGAGEVGRDPFVGHPSLFVQPAGSRCGVHVDSFHSQFAQTVLRGRKRWLLWALGAADQVRLLGRRDEACLEVYKGRRARRRIVYSQGFPPGRPEEAPGGEALAPSLQPFRVEAEVGEGETILVPGGVAHQVLNLEDTIAVSQNFIDALHAPEAALELRWPVPYHDLADFLEAAA